MVLVICIYIFYISLFPVICYIQNIIKLMIMVQFSDLRSLEVRPAHMSVFLNYLMSTPNTDPSPTFFLLITNIYYNTGGSAKQLLKWAVEIHSSFIVSGAPLKIDIEEKTEKKIDSVLVQKSDKEESLRSIFIEARNGVFPEIQSQLNEFRHKKDIQGLGNMYGAQELRESMRKQDEIEAVNRILLPHLERLLPKESEENARSDRDLAMGWALCTFLRSVGVNKHTSLERIQSFVMKDKKSIRIGGSQSKKRSNKGHQFTQIHLSKVEFCMHCQQVIWGVGYQGYQCSECENKIHKHCIDDLDELEVCAKKKMKRTSGIFRKSQPGGVVKMVLPEIWNSAIPPIKDSDKESNSPGPQSNTVFNITPVKDEEEADLANLQQAPHSVNRLVDRFNQMLPEGQQQQTESTHNDVDMDENALKALNNSGSSSTSSISNKSVESPSNSMDAVNNIIQSVADDSDFDIETELPPLKDIFPEDVFRKLKPKERKRQEVINELFYTEKSHVRNLKILDVLFYKPMAQDPSIPQDFVKTLFPNIHEMIQLHSSLNAEMKIKKKENPVVSEVGEILLKRFDGEEGEAFRNGCAIYCRNQAHALEALKFRRRDARLAQFLNEAESHYLMRKLQLKDFIPMQMMRLTKYPLLIENLMKYTLAQSEEHARLDRALQCSKHILEFVNQAVKEFENHYKLEQLQRRIDKKSIDDDYKHLDLTKHKLIYEGILMWNINVRKSIDVHVVLLEDMLVLLQKQDDKILLKKQSTTLVAGKGGSFEFIPVLKLNFILHTNSKATDKKTFFVISKDQIYELTAPTAEERSKWCKFIKEAADRVKNKSIGAGMAASQPQTPEFIVSDREQITGARRPSASDSAKTLDQEETGQVLHQEETDLISPEEMDINETASSVAQPVLTPLEKIRRYDIIVQETLEMKKKQVSDILGVPIVVTPSKTQEMLQSGVNSIEDLISTGVQETADCINLINNTESGLAKEDLTMPIPMDKLQEMACSMNQILTNLLAIVNSRDEERERLRAELKAAQDGLNYLREIQRRVTSPPDIKVECPKTYISDGSSCSEDDGNLKQATTDSDGNIVPVEAEPVVQAENVAEDYEGDIEKESDEQDVIVATAMPTDIEDIPTDDLREAEPPEDESVEDVDPPFVSEQELVNSEEVQEAELHHVDDEVEEVTEMFAELITDVSRSEEMSSDLIKRCDSNDDYKDASDNLEDVQENAIQESVQETLKSDIVNVIEENLNVVEESDNVVDKLTDNDKTCGDADNSVDTESVQNRTDTISTSEEKCDENNGDEKKEHSSERTCDVDDEEGKLDLKLTNNVENENDENEKGIDKNSSQIENSADLIEQIHEQDKNENKLDCENENKTFEKNLDSENSITLSGTEEISESGNI
ncbi:hypothetical protein KUTeg_006079 [Tegillarca granosa]|uniref:Uncharacterized protein n=1 Tax=Tegillarca granosa TaxID=220873 RepID=A0ABQ9FK67_TEGGR|nr:hypothetical protein KUTeg_006079 [Tegillarca granosa]